MEWSMSSMYMNKQKWKKIIAIIAKLLKFKNKNKIQILLHMNNKNQNNKKNKKLKMKVINGNVNIVIIKIKWILKILIQIFVKNVINKTKISKN